MRGWAGCGGAERADSALVGIWFCQGAMVSASTVCFQAIPLRVRGTIRGSELRPARRCYPKSIA